MDSEFSEPEIEEFINIMLKKDEHYLYVEFFENLSPELNEYMNIVSKELEQRMKLVDYLNILDTFLDIDLEVHLSKICRVFTYILPESLRQKLKHFGTDFSCALCNRIRILHDAKVIAWRSSLKKVMKTVAEYWPENTEGSLTILFEYLKTE